MNRGDGKPSMNVMSGGRRTGIVVVSVVVVAFLSVLGLALLSPAFVGTSDDPCVSCHGVDYAESCNLVPNDGRASLPESFGGDPVSVRMAVSVEGDGSGSYYCISLLRVTLSSSEGRIGILEPSQSESVLYPGNVVTLEWSVQGVSDGSDTLTFELYAINNHRSSTFFDTYSYDVEVNLGGSSPTPGDAIVPDALNLDVGSDGAELRIEVVREVYHFTATTSPGFEVEPDYYYQVPPGYDLELTVRRTDETVEEPAVLIINWSDNGVPCSTIINLRSVEAADEQASALSIVGRVTGMLTLPLLAASFLLGGVSRRLTRWLSKRYGIGYGKRKKWHCYVSYAVLGLSVVHTVVLLLGPYFSMLTDMPMLVGFASLFLMGLVGLNGIYRKEITRRLGAKNWRRFHLYGSWLALALLLLHTWKLGTDIAIVAGWFGL